jgi:hypothetical protein
MVASYKIEADELIYSVIRKHVTDTQIRLILEDLISMPGNKSFRDTVGRLMELEKSMTKIAANHPRTRGAERLVGGTQPAVLVHAARSESTIKSRVIGTASRLVDSSI